MVKIVLEDKGQDLLWLKVNEGGLVEEAGPFQNEYTFLRIQGIWGLHVGQFCPIHHPPHIIKGFLKYRIESIEKEP